jgi:tripartite-type tricarboxylate transporter receptor subunit TctC
MSVVPLRLLFVILSLLLPASFAAAENASYPDRPITMVVTFAAGGSSDVLARATADAL